MTDKLYVIAAHNNYAGYPARVRLYHDFAKHMADSGVELRTVESVIGDRPFEVTTAHNPHHVQLRANEELWHKENMLNIGIQRLPLDAKYIACIDADFTFLNPNWVKATISALQTYEIVQMCTHIAYLGPNQEIQNYRTAFVAGYNEGLPLEIGGRIVRKNDIFNTHHGISLPKTVYPGAPVGSVPSDKEQCGGFGPPGAAWAYRREALDKIGGLMDYCVLGAADFFMALGLIGCIRYRIPQGYHPSLKRRLLDWEHNALCTIRQNVGTVPGAICHHYHGDFRLRHYQTREEILVKYQFDPDRDIIYNSHGLLRLVDNGERRCFQLRDELRSYFFARAEGN